MKNFIDKVKNKILNKEDITYEEAITLSSIDENDIENLEILFAGADDIRKKFMGSGFDLCTIMNAKSGKCSEDCKYCSQSGHYDTGVIEYPLLNYDEILKRALELEEKGVHRFSLVTSGRGIEGEEFEKILDIYKKLRNDTNLKLCASLGIITYEQSIKLKESGVSMYHHNVETSSNNYENICTTHTYEDRIETIKSAMAAGLEICCGGIIGMNESFEDRIKMAFEIKKLNVKSVPINVLSSIKGTPFENIDTLVPFEILKAMAIYRYILPNAYIRYAGGRMALKDKQDIGFRAGINSALVGNYLTTVGSNIEEDKKMISLNGFEL